MTSEATITERLGAAPWTTPDLPAARVSWRPRRPQPRAWLSARQGPIGLASVGLSSLLVAVFAAGTRYMLPVSVRPVPSTLAGVFGGLRVELGLAGLIPLFAVMLSGYILAVRGASQLSTRAVLSVMTGVLLVVLLGPPLTSTDLFSYAAYGRMGALWGVNPYLHGPAVIAHDGFFPFVGVQWRQMPTTYGPLFTALTYPVAALDVAANVLFYKGLAAVATVSIVALVWRSALRRGSDPLRAVTVVALNPVILIWAVGGGHNDLLMVAVLMAGVDALIARRPRCSGTLIVTAVAVKMTAGLLLPFALAQTVADRDRRSGRRLLVSSALTTLVVAVLSLWLFGTGPLHLLSTIQTVQGMGGSHSIPGLVAKLLGFRHLGVGGPILDVGALAVIAYLAWRVATGRLDWIDAAGWAVLAVLVTAGALLPWYVSWLIPLAALGRDRRLLVAAIIMTGVGLSTL